MIRQPDIFSEDAVIKDILERFTRVPANTLDFCPPEIRKMLKCIHNHLFDESLTIDNVKKICRLSNNNVTTKFRRAVGIKPSEYIKNQRLKAAFAILQMTEGNIYLIAASIGYTEEAFSKLFKCKYGLPPLQYRQKYLREMNKKNEQEKRLRERIKST